jgi:hypothetical protein
MNVDKIKELAKRHKQLIDSNNYDEKELDTICDEIEFLLKSCNDYVSIRKDIFFNNLDSYNWLVESIIDEPERTPQSILVEDIKLDPTNYLTVFDSTILVKDEHGKEIK